MNSIYVFLIVITVLALMCPSAYTIAWSKEDKAPHLPILYAGLGISFFVLIAGFMDNLPLMWLGLFGAMAIFAYVIFFYKVK